MNKSQRIHLATGTTNADKHIIVQLEQDVDTLEFMTMNISTKDAYQDFNADYGVLVGRVIANNSVGIPNAKISIFIPLDDVDAEDSTIASIYPYKTPRDKNSDGKRYNLLPRVSTKDPKTGVVSPKQPFGSFPIKPEIVANIDFLDVYKKYYKYTALTNDSGDYMMFGVPIGVQTVHMSVDITDIGKYSMSPAAMVTNLGYSPNFFTDSNTKIKPSQDLSDLPNIETQEIAVDIIPFWGDTENFTIGITRQDFRIRSVLKNTFVIFGSVFTDGDKIMWGHASDPDKNDIYELYKMSDIVGSSQENMGIKEKRFGLPTERIYYYPESVSDAEINVGSATDQMLLLDKSEYSIYKQNGDFVLIINCNRKRVTINEAGQQIPADENTQGGLYTEFKGFMTLEITQDNLPLNFTTHGDHLYFKPIRHRLKFPQHATCGHTFRNPIFSSAPEDNDAWRRQYYTFTGGGIYSVTKFHGIILNTASESGEDNNGEGFSVKDKFNDACNTDLDRNAGLIQTNDYYFTGNSFYQLCPNTSISRTPIKGINSWDGFGANWLNMSIYLPQQGWVYDGYSYICCYRTNSTFTFFENNPNSNHYYMNDNTQQIVDGYRNTVGFARSDVNWTDFILMTKEDVLKMNQVQSKGFVTSSDGKTIRNPLSGTYVLQGKFRNGTCIPSGWGTASPICGGKMNGTCTCATNDPKTYFFKGFDTSDCVAFITGLGLI